MSHTLVLNSDGSPLSLLPLSVVLWQDAIRIIYTGSVTILHEYENWIVRAPSWQTHVPAVLMTTRYIKVSRFVGFSAEMVHLRDGYRCQYCGEQFPSDRLTLDHVKPKSKGGKLTFDNVVSACSPCNCRRGDDESIRPRTIPYRPTYMQLVARRRRMPVTVPHESWIPYIGWEPSLVTVDPPEGEPGLFLAKSEKRARSDQIMQLLMTA